VKAVPLEEVDMAGELSDEAAAAGEGAGGVLRSCAQSLQVLCLRRYPNDTGISQNCQQHLNTHTHTRDTTRDTQPM
jgi:hypothetical protein